MRPPLNAGENSAMPHGLHRASIASMRPPLNAGENSAMPHGLHRASIASMRPPLNAGENASQQVPRLLGKHGFNEAPAERGGEPLL